MSAPRVSEADFIQLFEEHGAAGTARILGITERNVYGRRQRLEEALRREIKAPLRRRERIERAEIPGRIHLDIEDGVVLVGSDAHYWPGIISTAHRAFVRACKELAPKAVIMNGDVLDGASISRHPPIGWEKKPSLIQEIETCQERLGEIEQAAGKARRIWTLGNHDSRLETRIATVAPEFARVKGVHLNDHFPEWESAWSCWINDTVVIKHRIRNGVHAAYMNTLHAGKSTVTGHLHSLKVTPHTDYQTYTRYGVDCGTLADIYGPQFNDYCEDGPRSWRSGFAVLTFRRGRLMWPEVVAVVEEGIVEFRGKEWMV